MINFKKETVDKISCYLNETDEMVLNEQYDTVRSKELLYNYKRIINLDCTKKITSNFTLFKTGISILDVNCEYNLEKYPFSKENSILIKRENMPLIILKTTNYDKILRPSIEKNHIFVPKGFKGKFYSNMSALYNENLELVLIKKEIISSEKHVLCEDFQRCDATITPGLSLLPTDSILSIEYSPYDHKPFYSRTINENGTYTKTDPNCISLVQEELNANTDRIGKYISNGMEKHLSLK